MKREHSGPIGRGLQCLTDKGYRFTAIVSDGGTGIKKAILKHYGQIPHQVCMAHIHRDMSNALGKSLQILECNN